MALCDRTGRRMVAVVCAVLAACTVLGAQAAPGNLLQGVLTTVSASGTHPFGERLAGDTHLHSQGPGFGAVRIAPTNCDFGQRRGTGGAATVPGAATWSNT